MNYKYDIYCRANDLIKSGKNIQNWNNNDLWKIFEYYTAIELTNEYKTPFYCYEDIDPTFKEDNNMSKNDTGIDLSNLTDSIVQCKMRKNTLTFTECSTFLASQNSLCNQTNTLIIRWKNMLLARNSNMSLSDELKRRIHIRQLIDKPYNTNTIINYCKELLDNPPTIQQNINNAITIRDYQQDCINLINNTNNNIAICLPTGTGKNIVIINSIIPDKKYLILVPRIILMDQLKEEIIKYRPSLKNTIQTIGDGNNKFNITKNITICVYNSVSKIEPYILEFHKIYIKYDDTTIIKLKELLLNYNNNITSSSQIELDFIEKLD
jgi:hypothetical protein